MTRRLVCFFISGLLVPLAKGHGGHDGAILARQNSAVSVHPLSTVTPSQSAVSVHPLTTVTYTSTATRYVVSVPSRPINTPVVSVLPLTTITLSGSVVSVRPMATITLFPAPMPAPSAASTSSSSSSSSGHTGAIAGGVVGGLAVIIAAIAAFLFIRCRKSPHRWRRQQSSAGKWHDLEAKSTPGYNAGLAADVGNPFGGSFHKREAKPPIAGTADTQFNPTTPSEDHFVSPTTPRFDSIAPLLIRDKRRPSAVDPFADSYSPPARASSFMSPSSGSSHHRTDSASYIEMNSHDTAGSATGHGSTAGGLLPDLKHKKSLSDMIPPGYMVPDMPMPQPTAM